MKRSSLKTLLQKLEAIEEDHDGLGEPGVRELMGEHLRRAFFKPEPGFVPSGDYGLEPEANRKVAAALGAFCKSAETAAQRLGLTTFAQRVAAFQDPTVVTASGADYNDYLGVIELELKSAKGTEVVKSQTLKLVKRAYVFDHPGSLKTLGNVFNEQGSWSWQVAGGGAEDPYLDTRPETGIRVRVREGMEKMEADGSIIPPEHGYMALLEVKPDRIDTVAAAFLQTLSQATATNVGEKSSYWW